MMLRAMIKQINKPPKLCSIEDKLEAYQKAVDGYIEVVPIGHGVLAIVDECGILNNKQFNLTIAGYQLFGTVLFVSSEGEDFGSLSGTQIDYIRDLCGNKHKSEWKVYHKGNYLGNSRAVSKNRAINNMRYRKSMLYAPINEFEAIKK